MQKLLLLEVMLRLVNADQTVHENEIQFLKIVKVFLRIPDEMIIERFGEISYLTRSKQAVLKQSEAVNFVNSFNGFEDIKINSISD